MNMLTHPRIFVQMVGFRDPECPHTIADLFAKAAHPERVFVGLCQQMDAAEDAECLVDAAAYPGHLRQITFDWREAQGAGWARAQAQRLWQGEEYLLQIQAHMRFEPGWDETLIELLESCPNPKTILTGWLPGYRPDRPLVRPEKQLPTPRIGRVGPLHDAQVLHLHKQLKPISALSGRLYPSCFWVGNFMFARSTIMREVPFDPHVYFWGEELNFSARAWTHGWDMLQLDRVVLYHYWDRAGVKGEALYRDHHKRRNQLSLKRNRHLFGLEPSDEAEALVNLEDYPLGTARPLAEYWDFVGYDPLTRQLALKAERGEWGAPVRLDGSSGLPRIFVEIASFRDRECQWTVKDLFEKAAHPERITVGICQQVDEAEDADCFIEPYPFPAQVREKRVDYRQSQGANWGRHQAHLLWQGEEYILQIDSHLRFEPGWDETLLNMLARCPSAKPVISAYLPNYDPPDAVQRNGNKLLRMCVRQLGGENDPQLVHLTGVFTGPKDARAGLYQTPFWIGNFMFARAEAIEEVPFDPHIRFYGDEITYSARLWTHGWDIFQPDAVVAYHHWVRKGSFHLLGYRQPAYAKAPYVRERVRQVLGFAETVDAQALEEIGKYGLGKARPLAALWRFMGIDWHRQRVSDGAKLGWWSTPLPELTTKQPRIFVQIASYRDRECQWTVKDLFEKADHPDRIGVGICWQFDPEEDADCFQISVRPEQVRVSPYDWREGEGVCWARHITGGLWEGEEYTLQIDAHMRFAPGWDTTLLEDLALCEAPKPLLSCSPAAYTPPDKLQKRHPTVRRVGRFDSTGNIRGKGEVLNRVPPKPLNGAFVAAGFVFARAEIIAEVPVDPYLYFDQEEITWAARLYTHGWDVFSARLPPIYHYYNEAKQTVRPLHWRDLNAADQKQITFLRERGLKRFNHITGHQLSKDAEVLRDLAQYPFGQARSLKDFEIYTGIDFVQKTVSDVGLGARFIEGLDLYRDTPIPLHAPAKPDAAPIPKAMPAQPLLQPGDSVPLFQVYDQERASRAIETHAGRPCLLYFLPADEAFLRPFFSSLQASLEKLDSALYWPLFVLNAPPKKLKQLKEALGIPHALWADGQRKLFRSFGASEGDADAPACFLLNRSLRVERSYARLDYPALAAQPVADLQALMAKPAAPIIIREQAPALIVPNVLPPEFCRYCIERFENGQTFDGTVGAGTQARVRPGAKIRRDFIAPNDLLRELDFRFSSALFPEIEKVFGFRVTHRELYKIGCYEGEKGGFFRAHRDNFDPPLGYRAVAMTLHLNEDFEGGGLRFPEYGDAVYKIPQGAAIVFPCANLHEAVPVLSGKRYVVVGFFHGDENEAFRRHRLAEEGKPLKIDQYRLLAGRDYTGISTSRSYWRDWQREAGRLLPDEQP